MNEKKKTFTYATAPTIKERAAKKAQKEGLSLSEKIDEFLRAYVKPVRNHKPKLPLPKDYKDIKTVFVDPFGGTHELK